jgi:hypothetical protein
VQILHRHAFDALECLVKAELPVEVDFLAREVRHAARGALEIQHEAALEMVLRSLEFGRGQRLVLEPAQLAHHDIDQLAGRLVRAAGVNRHRSRVAIRAQAAEDRVGETALFTNVLKQTRAHRPAKNRVEHVARVSILMILPVPARAEADVALLELLRADGDPWNHDGRGFGNVHALAWNGAKGTLDEVADALVIDVADSSNNQVRRGVHTVEVAPQGRRGQRLDGLFRPENRAPERVPFPQMLGEQLVDQVVGGVLDHLDLFEHDLLFSFDVGRRKRWSPDDIGQHIKGNRQMFVEHLDVVARILLRREGVHLAADRVDRLRDVFRATSRRTLEQHVLDEVRDAALRLRLVAGTARKPHPDADRSHVRHLLCEKPEAVGEHVADNDGLCHGCAGICWRRRGPSLPRRARNAPQVIDRQGIRRTSKS